MIFRFMTELKEKTNAPKLPKTFMLSPNSYLNQFGDGDIEFRIMDAPDAVWIIDPNKLHDMIDWLNEAAKYMDYQHEEETEK